MDNLLLFTKEDENILNKYTLISKNSLEEKEYENYVEKYPALENEDLYIVNDMSKEERENFIVSLTPLPSHLSVCLVHPGLQYCRFYLQNLKPYQIQHSLIEIWRYILTHLLMVNIGG